MSTTALLIILATLFLWWQIRSTRPKDGSPRPTLESFRAEMAKEKADFMRGMMDETRALSQTVARETAEEIAWRETRPKMCNYAFQEVELMARKNPSP